ncbi:MAG TPA: Ig-like domain-containing protein [Longimicrobium sp.]
MKRLLPAYLLLALAAGACDSPSASGPRVDRVVVTPDARNLNAGDSFQLTAVARDEESELVTGVEFEWASLEQDVATVTQTGVVTGVRTGTARIVASAEGKADTATITVFGTAAECGEAGSGLTLAVGESVQRDGAAGSVLCLEGGAAGAEFTVIPFFGSSTSSGTLSLRASGAGLAAVAGPPTPSLAPVSITGGVSADAGVGAHADGGFHTRLNEAVREPLGRQVAGARAAYGRRGAGGARLALQQSSPAVGSLLPLNGGLEGCSAPASRAGRVVAVSQRAVVVADTSNPAGGLTDADYQHVAATFDSLVYPVNVAAFGEPGDVDQNGRVIIFYTRVVNELTPRSVNYIVGGFFYGRDLFPRTPDPSSGFAEGCPGSNYAEMFYMLAADPTGVVNGNTRSVEYVRESTIGVVGHEFQHLINASRRLYTVPGVVDTNWNEVVYLNEGLSHIAEELLFYHRAQLGPRQNLGGAILAQGTLTRAAFLAFGEQNEGRYGEYLRDPETNSPYKNDDDLAVRGAAWAFLRYVADQQPVQNDARLWYDLVNNDRVGLANLREVLGQDPIPLFRSFAVSVYTDDAVAGVPAVFTQPSWNHRTLWQNASGGFPLRVRPLTSGAPVDVTLTAGGASYLRAAVAAGRRGSVQLTSGGAVLPENVSVTVVRTK